VSFISENFQSNNQEFRLRLPNRPEEEFALVTLLTGAEYIKVMCEDGVERPARIPGKMRNRIFIKDNDVVIIKKREYDDGKYDVIWRYLPLQVQKLKSFGHLEKLPI
jgi:translation initiation factor 1A